MLNIKGIETNLSQINWEIQDKMWFMWHIMLYNGQLIREMYEIIYPLINNTGNEYAIVYFPCISYYSVVEVISSLLKVFIQNEVLREIKVECTFLY